MYSLELLRYGQQLDQERAKRLEAKASTAAVAITSRDPVTGDKLLALADGGVTRRPWGI